MWVFVTGLHRHTSGIKGVSQVQFVMHGHHLQNFTSIV